MGIGGVIKFFAWIIAFIFLFYLFSIWFTGEMTGEFGIAPVKDTCEGFIVVPAAAASFPNGSISFNFLGKTYVYKIDHSSEKVYCLGQAEERSN